MAFDAIKGELDDDDEPMAALAAPKCGLVTATGDADVGIPLMLLLPLLMLDCLPAAMANGCKPIILPIFCKDTPENAPLDAAAAWNPACRTAAPTAAEDTDAGLNGPPTPWKPPGSCGPWRARIQQTCNGPESRASSNARGISTIANGT